jgi:UDP-2,3-diacylglucosamine hydrolase
MSGVSNNGELLFIGDVHLDRDDPDLEAFVVFLDSTAQRASTVVLMGDLFNLWIGDRALEQPHQRAVIEALTRLRAQGVVVRYVEGNRDYRVASAYLDTALDASSASALCERRGTRCLRAIHGDLTNPADRQYRLWRRISRSTLFWTLFRCLPAGRRLRLAESIERRMRRSNVAFKGAFPEAEVRQYAQQLLLPGESDLVLGHFHVEKELELDGGAQRRVWVLPDWKSSRRHLRVTADGAIAFVDSL